MSPVASPDKIAATAIPNITALRRGLDYGDANLPRCAAFYDDMRVFRKKFKTSRGVPGTELHDWKSREGQTALGEMTYAYLDKEGNGLVFWPDDPSAANYNEYQYTKDKYSIRRLVKQLFFRLNQQQFRNKKYKHKDSDSQKDSQETSQQTQPMVIDLEQDESDNDSIKLPLNLAFGSGSGSGSNRTLGGSNDIYSVPPKPASPPRMRQFESINHSPKRGADGDHEEIFSELSPSKRRKGKQPIRPATVAAPTKRPPREKRPPHRPGMIGLDDVDTDIYEESGENENQIEASTTHIRPARQQSPPPVLRRPEDVSVVSLELSPQARSSRTVEPSPFPEIEYKSLSPVRSDLPRFSSISTVPSLVGDASRRESPNPIPEPEPEPKHNPKPPPPPPPPQLAPPPTTPTPTPTAPAASRLKPSITMIYRVVLSRDPIPIIERWHPQGRFQDKSLADLHGELPFAQPESQGLIFTIDSPCLRTVEQVPNGDEDGFASLKRCVNKAIRDWLGRERGRGGGLPRLVVDVLIEKMGEGGAGGGVELDDLELEW